MKLENTSADAEAPHEHVRRLEAELAAERAACARAREEARRKDEFLAMVAHELRAPLGAIVGWVHMLRRRGGEEEFDKGLEVIEQSALVQDKLVGDLLVMSRAAGGGMAFQPERLDPRAFIEAAIELLRPVGVAKGIHLRAAVDAPVGAVRGDPIRLQQVMTNLLSNAVKFTPQGGCIEIALRRHRGWAEITVTDDGIGIAAGFLPHIFERFRQDPGIARSHGGLGLGLAIARDLVELHGGSIEARSDGEGRGATFVVRLPLVDAR